MKQPFALIAPASGHADLIVIVEFKQLSAECAASHTFIRQ
jgi:hypothetical protein